MRAMRYIVFFLLLCVFFLPFAHEVRALAVNHIEVGVPKEAHIQTKWWNAIRQYIGIRNVIPIHPKEGTVFRVHSSAYASSPYQTDSTPCVTAAGTMVRPGVVATNFLPLGTIVSINNKKYIVEDRMNSRYSGYYLDIWFSSTEEALEFGRKKLEITIIEYSKPGADLDSSPSPEPKKKSLWDLIFTRTYSDPNKYDIDCSK